MKKPIYVFNWQIVKHDELGQKLGMKIGRFIRFEEDNLKGKHRKWLFLIL